MRERKPINNNARGYQGATVGIFNLVITFCVRTGQEAALRVLTDVIEFATLMKHQFTM